MYNYLIVKNTDENIVILQQKIRKNAKFNDLNLKDNCDFKVIIEDK
jgi:hypothetical protein